jgi:hypothetical protein
MTNELSEGNYTSFQRQNPSLRRGYSAMALLMKWIPTFRISGVNDQPEVTKVIFAFDTTIVRTTRQYQRPPSFTTFFASY